ncbi:MAG TPA: bacillithiol biosynthesis deacetylase BshB1 [bacterium]|nr:bacillithiol biosynthesis deacetylase BshB1 [bacterium]
MNTVTDPGDLPRCDVLAVGPHPDDIEIACGGSLLRLRQQGASLCLLDLTRGEMGSSGTVEDRDREALAAATALQAAARANLGLPDTRVTDDDDSTARLVAAMRAVRPKLLFAPHERDVHPDHTAGAHLVTRAHFLAGLRNYHPELGEPHRARVLLRYPGNHPVEPTLVVDISSVADQKEAVVRCYQSQLAPSDTGHLVQGLDLLERAIIRQRAMGALVATAAGEGFVVDGPLAVDELGWLVETPTDR